MVVVGKGEFGRMRVGDFRQDYGCEVSCGGGGRCGVFGEDGGVIGDTRVEEGDAGVCRGVGRSGFLRHCGFAERISDAVKLVVQNRQCFWVLEDDARLLAIVRWTDTLRVVLSNR